MASVAPGPPRPSALSGRWSDVALGITWKEARRPAFKVPRQTRALYCCPQQTHHRRPHTATDSNIQGPKATNRHRQGQTATDNHKQA